MDRFSRYGMITARVMVAMVFLLNALGVIDQTIPAREMAERGVPANLVPFMMFAGRSVEFIGGLMLIFGIFPRVAALAVFAFLVPATLVSHSFWLAAGTPGFMGQLINFSKNLAILGGLLFIASTGNGASVTRTVDRRVNDE